MRLLVILAVLYGLRGTAAAGVCMSDEEAIEARTGTAAALAPAPTATAPAPVQVTAGNAVARAPRSGTHNAA
jgi:hypothetical protein